MKQRYAGVCRLCGAELAARTEAIHERSTKTVRCLDCSPGDPVSPIESIPLVEPVEAPEPIDIGTPGASARREYERRQAKRETRIREKHPKLGGLILAISDDPQSTTAWDTEPSARKESASVSTSSPPTRCVSSTTAASPARAPTSTTSPSRRPSIYVIDPKRYKGRPSLKVEGGLLRPRTEKLLVGTRDQTKLVDGVLKQVDVVRAIVGDGIPVTGVLCFIEADWPLIGGAFTTRGVEVLWPRKLYPRLTAEGLIASGVDDLHRTLASALPRA